MSIHSIEISRRERRDCETLSHSQNNILIELVINLKTSDTTALKLYVLEKCQGTLFDNLRN